MEKLALYLLILVQILCRTPSWILSINAASWLAEALAWSFSIRRQYPQKLSSVCYQNNSAVNLNKLINSLSAGSKPAVSSSKTNALQLYFTRRICPPDNSNGLRSNNSSEIPTKLIFVLSVQHLLFDTPNILCGPKRHLLKLSHQNLTFSKLKNQSYFSTYLFNILVYRCRSNLTSLITTLPSVIIKKSIQ